MPRQLTTLARKKIAVSALEDIKARDIVAIDVRKVTGIFDWVLVATAESARQTKALARHVRDKLREADVSIIGMEGEESGDWVLVDTGDIVVHVMQPAVRAYYDLEELWGDGKFDNAFNPSAPQQYVPPVKTRAPRKARAAAKSTTSTTPKPRPKPKPKPKPKPRSKAKAKAK